MYSNNYVFKDIVENWDDIYLNYRKLNPDLTKKGINNKRQLLNHFETYGYRENRQIFENDSDGINLARKSMNYDYNNIIIPAIEINKSNKIIKTEPINKEPVKPQNIKIKLNKKMFIEKI